MHRVRRQCVGDSAKQTQAFLITDESSVGLLIAPQPWSCVILVRPASLQLLLPHPPNEKSPGVAMMAPAVVY